MAGSTTERVREDTPCSIERVRQLWTRCDQHHHILCVDGLLKCSVVGGPEFEVFKVFGAEQFATLLHGKFLQVTDAYLGGLYRNDHGVCEGLKVAGYSDRYMVERAGLPVPVL